MSDTERWHDQTKENIWDSVNDWDYHKFACISKGGDLLEYCGFRDEDMEGMVWTNIECLTNDGYSTDDIAYWIEYPD